MIGDHRPGFEIRSATAEDIPALTELEIEAGQRFADIGFEVIAADDPPTAEEFRPAIDDGHRPWGKASSHSSSEPSMTSSNR